MWDFFLFGSFPSSFFSLRLRAFCLEKSGAIHFTSLLCSCFPSFGKSSFFCFFLISIFVGATAQHPQHTDDKEGWGSRKAGYTNIVPEEEKEETIRIKRDEGEHRGGKKRERRESSINNFIPSLAGFITNRVLIAFHDFS